VKLEAKKPTNTEYIGIMLTDLDSPNSPEISDGEAAAATEEVVEDGVEVIEVGNEGDDTWETTASLVGLSNRDPDVVAAATTLNQHGPEEDAPKEAWIEPSGVCSPEAIERLSKPKKEVASEALDFNPVLVGSKKKRAAAKGTGYGSRVIQKKAPPAPKALDFKPQLNFGSKASARRMASPGSQYGKAVPKPKPKKDNLPSFTPKIDVSAKSTAIRNKAKSRALDAAAKAAAEGKKVREAAKAKQEAARQELGFGRHTLAGDRSGPKETKPAVDANQMNFSPTPLHSLEVSAVQHTKKGNDAKAKAKSHYKTEHYRPKTGEKPKPAPKQKGWALSYVAPAEHEEVPDLPKAKTGKLKAKAKSHYRTETYTPKKGEKPVHKEIPKVESDWVHTDVHANEVIGKTASEIAGDVANSPKPKFATVESSGYGVVSPVPSIEAKVKAAQVRSASNLMGSSDYKLKQQQEAAASGMKKGGIAADGAENVAPKATKLSTDSSSLINALLHRAAALDDSVNLSKPPAAAVDGGDEEDGETTAL